MMLAWLRHDEALRHWPLWAVLSALNATLMLGFITLGSLRRGGSAPEWALLLAIWPGVAAFLIFGNVRTRCGSLQLALPLSARRLWLNHVLAVALMGCIVAFAPVAVMLVLQRTLGGPSAFNSGTFADWAPLLITGVALAAVLLQVPGSGLARIRLTPGYALWTAAVLVAVPAMLVLLSPMGAAWTALPLVVSVVVAAHALARLPAALSLVPPAPEPGSAATAMATATSSADADALTRRERASAEPGSQRWAVARAIWSCVSGGGKEWFSYPAILLFAAIMGGLLGPLEDAEALRYLYIPMSIFVLFSLIGPRLARLHHLDPLPIPRRALFAVLVVPYLLTFAGGYGIGALVAAGAARRGDLVDYREARGRVGVVVPVRVCEVAWNGRPPAVTTAWGETRTPIAMPLWRGSRAVLYSPYGTPEGSSREFVAWQLGRAAESVYGVRIASAEIADRDLDVRADGRVVPRNGGTSLRARLVGQAPRGAGPMFPVMTTMVCLPWLLLVGLLLLGYRPGVPEWARQALAWASMALALAATMGIMGLILADALEPWLLNAMFEIPVHQLGASPLLVGATWIGAALLLLVGYRIALRQFERMEIPPRPTKYVLADWLSHES